MSEARKCDKCDQLFAPTQGCVSVNISVKDKTDTYHTWNDVDFCENCSSSLLNLIGSALHGLRRPRVRKETK